MTASMHPPVPNRLRGYAPRRYQAKPVWVVETCLEFSGCFERQSGGVDVVRHVSVDGAQRFSEWWWCRWLVGGKQRA